MISRYFIIFCFDFISFDFVLFVLGVVVLVVFFVAAVGGFLSGLASRNKLREETERNLSFTLC